MARITVEDCIVQVPNRFELVHLAALRSRQLSHGFEPLVRRDNDKNTIIALREIGDGQLAADKIKQTLIDALRSIEDDDLLHEDLIDESAGIGEPITPFDYNAEDRAARTAEGKSYAARASKFETISTDDDWIGARLDTSSVGGGMDE